MRYWQLFTGVLVYFVMVVGMGAAAKEPAGSTRERDVIYGRKAGMALVMDVRKPAKQNGAGVIFVVSGGFNSGIEKIDSGFFDPAMFQPLLDRGYTLFFVSHGSEPKFTVNEIVPDLHRAVRFIRTHGERFGIEPNRIGITGISSGGFLSLTMGVRGGEGDAGAADPVERASSRVQAVAAFCPPTDLVDYGEEGRSFLEYEPVDFVEHAFALEGKTKTEQIEALRELSPIAAITSDAAPMMLLHGDADTLVPYEQSERFDAKLAEAGVPHKLIRREKGWHVWPTMNEDFVLVADWFDEHLSAGVKGD